MAQPVEIATRGVLRIPPEGHWELRRWKPCSQLVAQVAFYWVVCWDLRGRAAHQQGALPHPAPHLVVENGCAVLYGPQRERFDRTLVGTGRVVGARFRPGALRPALGMSVASITDRAVPVDALGLKGQALASALDDEEGLDAAVAAMERSLLSVLPGQLDPRGARAQRAVDLLATDASLARVADLATALGMSPRSLQRLFRDEVGVAPGWVARRYRLHEAVAQTMAEGGLNGARLAVEVGYADQARLVRDFATTIGTSPGRYAAAVAR